MFVVLALTVAVCQGADIKPPPYKYIGPKFYTYTGPTLSVPSHPSVRLNPFTATTHRTGGVDEFTFHTKNYTGVRNVVSKSY